MFNFQIPYTKVTAREAQTPLCRDYLPVRDRQSHSLHVSQSGDNDTEAGRGRGFGSGAYPLANRNGRFAGLPDNVFISTNNNLHCH